ncbi:RNA polymerase sigma factor [Algihabitans sp.]|uniref:RNA polymerase sigma factor n=1 Tax=Algihabitans sp. TaxID=2821514 RepID=UPI003BAC74D6
MEREQEIKKELVALLPRLRRFATALTGSQHEADDVVQAACERALTRLHQWQEGTRLDSWMFRIVQTVWIDRCRAERLRRPAGDLDSVAGVTGDDGRDVAESRIELARVRKLIARLPEEQRAVLSLVSIDGCSYRQAAESLNIPIGTVMSRLARARRALAEALNGPHNSPWGKVAGEPA